MPDKANPIVPIKLDKERHLKFGMRAMLAFEEKTGKNVLKGLSGDMSGTELVTLFWACLLHEDKKLTFDAAVDLFDEYSTVYDLAEKVTQARNLGMPEEKGEIDRPLAESSPDGSSSGALVDLPSD